MGSAHPEFQSDINLRGRLPGLCYIAMSEISCKNRLKEVGSIDGVFIEITLDSMKEHGK